MKKGIAVMAALALAGTADAMYLTYEHYSGIIPPCSNSVFVDCGKVLQSEYAVIMGVPLAVIGIVYYVSTLLTALVAAGSGRREGRYVLLVLTAGGLAASLLFVYLQIFVIHAICLYCMLSASLSVALFACAQITFSRERQHATSLARGAIRRLLSR